MIFLKAEVYMKWVLYHNQQHKVNPIPKAVRILNVVHNIRPAFQGNDQEYSDPRHSDVIERNRSLKRIATQLRAIRIVLVPVYARSVRRVIVGVGLCAGFNCLRLLKT